MAPESILAPDSADARTDIYALGAVAFYLLAGVDVFHGKSIVEVCSQHLHKSRSRCRREASRSRPSSKPSCSRASTRIPRRPQSALELRRRLEACAVEPWDSERALAWWRDYKPTSMALAAESTGEVRTLAVDGARRAAAALTRSIN